MEFEGVVYKIMPVTRGTSARGEWQRQDVVFDYNDGGQFSRKICVTFFNKESDVAKLREGETFLVSVNIESREYNGFSPIYMMENYEELAKELHENIYEMENYQPSTKVIGLEKSIYEKFGGPE